MNDLTLVMAVYGQPLMLSKQLETIRVYPNHVLDHLHVVVVDDCGNPPVDILLIDHLSIGIKSAKLFRVEKDIPWNQPGARNLAMKHASGWCAMIDPDMLFSGEMIAKIMDRLSSMKRGQNLRFHLKHTDSGRIDNGSPNTHIVHRDDFMDAAGYDEDFAGRKGYSDVVFARTMRRLGIKETWDKSIWALFHGTRDFPDANVITLDRSVAANRGLFRSKMRIVDGSREGLLKWIAQRKSKMIRFPWKQLFPAP